VTNVEDAAHFGVEPRFVVKIRIAPGDGFARRRFETAFFAHGKQVSGEYREQ
jgi:hypothetical protein